MTTITRTPEEIHHMLDFVLGQMWDNLPDVCYCTEDGEELAESDELYPQMELHKPFCYAPLAKYLTEKLVDGKADRGTAEHVARQLSCRNNGEDGCLCVERPWLDKAENGDTDWEEMYENPASHSQYCPTYLIAYCNAIANDTEAPE